MNDISGSSLSVNVVNKNVGFNGATVKGNNIYISADVLEDGTWGEVLTEEITHFSEGTEEYAQLVSFLLEDGKLTKEVLSELTSDGNGYGFTERDIEDVTRKMERATRAGKETEGVQYSKNKNFVKEIDEWNREGRPENGYFVLGTTGDVLQGLGAIESDIYMQDGKINTILREHPETTLDEIKKIPDILDDPVLILKSRNVGRGNRANTRLVIFGNIKAKNGQPILSVLDLRPNEKNLIIDDMQKVTSAYTKTQNALDFVRNSDVVYADKRRTTPLLRTIGFHMPIELNESGYIGSISYNGQNVNIFGESFSKIVREGKNIPDSEQNVNSNSKKSVQYSKKKAENGASMSGETLTSNEQTLLSELYAHMSAKILGGDERFIERLIRKYPKI